LTGHSLFVNRLLGSVTAIYRLSGAIGVTITVRFLTFIPFSVLTLSFGWW